MEGDAPAGEDHGQDPQREIHSVSDGPGPVVAVFTPGWLNDLSVWDGVVSELAEDSVRCVRWDLPGQGGSPAVGRGEYGRDAVLRDLAGVIELNAGEESVILVGHSFGGYLSLAQAIERPQLTKGLVLVAAGPGFRNPDSMQKWNESVQRTALKTPHLPDGQEALSMHTDSMVIDRLAEITAPVAVVVGERDKGFLASANIFERTLNVQHSEVVPEAGHMVHVKHAARVGAAVRKVLQAE